MASPRIRSKTLLVSAVVLLAVIYLVWQRINPTPQTVWVTTATMGPVEATVANTRAGTVKACRRSRLSMPIGGVVDQLLVSEGDKVEKDQLLLELWNRDRAADVEQASETLKATQAEQKLTCLEAEHKVREARRLRGLASGLASEEAIDRADTSAQTQLQLCAASKNQTGVAGARLNLQQAIFERTQLRAPFAGIVAEINGEIGEYITPSPPGIPTPAAIDLIDYDCLYVTAPIDEVDASRLQLGLPTRIELDAFRNQPLVGSITRIAPYVLDLEKQARTVDIDVQLQQVPETMRLLVGYSADITAIIDSKTETLRLPAETVLPDNSVWLVTDDNHLQKRKVTTGIGNWSYIEVLSGLQAGDKVLRNPDLQGLSEGMPVIINNSANAHD